MRVILINGSLHHKGNKNVTLLCVLALMAPSLSSCNSNASKHTTEESVPQDDTVSVRTYVQQMYDDILSKYNKGEEALNYANKTYGSSKFVKVISDLDTAIENGDIQPLVYGWGCDPWIMAQDWVDNMSADIARTQILPDGSCIVTVDICCGNDGGHWSSPVLHLVVEDDVWKVDDFLLSDKGGEMQTYIEALRSVEIK